MLEYEYSDNLMAKDKGDLVFKTKKIKLRKRKIKDQSFEINR